MLNFQWKTEQIINIYKLIKPTLAPKEIWIEDGDMEMENGLGVTEPYIILSGNFFALNGINKQTNNSF